MEIEGHRFEAKRPRKDCCSHGYKCNESQDPARDVTRQWARGRANVGVCAGVRNPERKEFQGKPCVLNTHKVDNTDRSTCQIILQHKQHLLFARNEASDAMLLRNTSCR